MIDQAQLLADAEECKPAPSDAALAHISSLGKLQRKLERAVERREKLVDLTKKKLAKVAEKDLPEAMAAVGMSDFGLDDGSRIEVDLEYYANIPAPDSDKPELLERRTAAFQWFHDSGNAALIKSQILVEAGRGDEERTKAERVMRGLKAAGIPFTNTEGIHWSTLRAFVKEQIEAGKPLPEHLLGVHVKRVSSVKAPKQTKTKVKQ